MLQASAASPVAASISIEKKSSVLIELDGISLSFGGVAALRDIDLSVRQGAIHAIIGPNGAGKSSIINIISGIYRPDKGAIRFSGETFRQIPTQRLAQLGVARTFQNLALFKGLSVLDNIILGLTSRARATFVEEIIGLKRSRNEEHRAHAAALDIIDFLELEAWQDRHPDTLPYGLQKRVELGRALVAEPKLLLLDEPMAGMTAAEKAEMSRFVRNARARFGTTVILIEHDIGVVMDLSDRITVLDYGRKITDGAPRDVRNDQRVIDAYLGAAQHELDEAVN